MRKIYWLAVQPTPYNFNFFKGLKKSQNFDFRICYSYRTEKNLPFSIKGIVVEDDYFFNKILWIDFSILRKAVFSKDEFMVVGWNDMTIILVMVLRRILKKPYYFWTDSVDPEKTKQNKRLVFKLKKWFLRGAKIVFTTGEFGVQKMIESQLVTDKNKIVALPFFVELHPKYTAREFNPQIDTLKLLQLSRLVIGKGIFNAIDGIGLLLDKEYKVNFAIGGIGEEKENLTNYITKKGLSKHITLLGWLDTESKRNRMLESHALLHAVDEHDPFPLVVLESLADGLPVIGTKLAGSVSDRVITGVNGIIVKSDPQSIANGILELYTKYNIKDLSKNARNLSMEWPSSRGLEIIEKTINHT